MRRVLIGMAPVFAFGVGALLRRAARGRVEIVNLISAAPAGKRSKRKRAVDAVVLHQMGFSRGSELQRYVRVTAHFVIMPDGKIGQLHPVSAQIPASNSFNDRAVAIEFAGNFQSANGKWWRPETYGRNVMTSAQRESGRRLLRKLARQGVRFVFAHRQSSADRGNCPGPEVWSTVGQWAIDKLGMSDGGESYSIGSGRPVPAAWRRFELPN